MLPASTPTDPRKRRRVIPLDEIQAVKAHWNDQAACDYGLVGQELMRLLGGEILDSLVIIWKLEVDAECSI